MRPNSGCLCVCVCVCACVRVHTCVFSGHVVFLFLSHLGPIYLIQVNCTFLLLLWKLGHPGSQTSHLELPHKCFAQRHRGKHIQRYLLVSLSSYTCRKTWQIQVSPAVWNSVPLSSSESQQRSSITCTILTNKRTSRPCSWGGVPHSIYSWEGSTWCPLSSSELSNRSSTTNLTAWAHCHKVVAPTMESGNKASVWGDGIRSCCCLVAGTIPSTWDFSWSNHAQIRLRLGSSGED